MSTRADLLPPEFIQELSHLQSDIPALPFSDLEPVLAQELGEEFRNQFQRIEETPLAAASIGQVHRVRLLSGDDAVIKVQRPGVAEEVAVDLFILRRLARRAARTTLGQVADLEGLMDEFSLTLERELDYVQEARNADRFRANLSHEKGIYIPSIHWGLTTSRVLTMEYVTGVRPDDMTGVDRLGIDRHAVAKRLARVYLKMIFENGFFHADPHSGNFFIQSDGTVVFIDFGMVGSFNEANREQLVSLLMALVRQDAEALIDRILDLGAGLTPLERQAATQDLQRMMTRYSERSLAGISMEALMNDILRFAYRHRLRLPANLSLLTKTLAMSEGLGRRLDPDFRSIDVLTPYARHLLMKEFGPRGLRRRLPLLALELADAAPRLPAILYRVLRRAERGDLVLGVESRQFNELLRAIRKAGERMSRSILVAALVIAATLLFIDLRGETPSSASVAGAGLAATLGFALWSIRKPG